jgi:hypothetical protein
MNSYRIDTFEMEDGTWKAVAYKCGSYLGEAKGSTEEWAIAKVALRVANVLRSQK